MYKEKKKEKKINGINALKNHVQFCWKNYNKIKYIPVLKATV